MERIRFDATGWRKRMDHGQAEANAARLAAGLAPVWSERNEGYSVIVGYDGRRHARRVAERVARVLADADLQPIVASRPCPTPALDWAVAHEPHCVGGIMLTASRMPREYAGMLVRQADAGPIDEAFVERVTQRIPRSADGPACEFERRDLVSAHQDNLVWSADRQLIEQAGLKVVVDPLYGACAGHARELLERVGCTVVPLHDELAPDFRGIHPDPREPWVDECERTVLASGADLGIVFDGDGDRCSIVDERGRLVSPYDLGLLVLDHLVRQRGLRGRVVVTAASSIRIARYARELDCPTTMVPVGINALYRELQDRDVLLAIDERGGMHIPAHMFPRDALMLALMVVELTCGTQETISEQIERIEQSVGSLEYGTRQVRVDLGVASRISHILPGVNPREVAGVRPQRVSHADGVRLTFSDTSWLLVRLASSEPVVRIYGEAATRSSLQGLLDAAVRAVDQSFMEEVWSVK